MQENKTVLTPYDKDGFKKFVAVVQKNKKIKLVPLEEVQINSSET